MTNKTLEERIAELETISKQKLDNKLVDCEWHMIRGETYVANLALEIIKELKAVIEAKNELQVITKGWTHEKISRIEIVDEKGRSYVNTSVKKFFVEFQDDDRTLKIFINEACKGGLDG